MARSLMVLLTGVLFVTAFAARHPATVTLSATATQAPQAMADYVGADACKACHGDIFKAWSLTKHSQALGKLRPADRVGDACIGCHVTGPPAAIVAEGAKPTHPNVQCEACHGPGRLHINAATSGNAASVRTATVDETTCTRCHNEKSPHYKLFHYQAMVGLVHR